MANNVEIIERQPEGAMSVQSPQPPAGMGTLFGSDDPGVVVQRATAASKALMDVVRAQNLSVSIQGGQHLRVEAWTLLGSMVGVFPVTVWTRPIKEGQRTTGWEARVEARTLGGAVVGSAETMCSRDERTWKDRDEHAIRSMAQTRAVSKALAAPLRFIAVLAGFAGTPAEEMPHDTGGGQSASPRPAQRQDVAHAAAGGKPLCQECAEAGFRSKNDYPPKFWPGKKTCDGVVAMNAQGKPIYANHPLPAEDVPDAPTPDPMGDVDPDEIPFHHRENEADRAAMLRRTRCR